MKLLKLYLAVVSLILLVISGCKDPKIEIKSEQELRSFVAGKQFHQDWYNHNGTSIKSPINIYFTDKYVWLESKEKEATTYEVIQEPLLTLGGDRTGKDKFIVSFYNKYYKGICTIEFYSEFSSIEDGFLFRYEDGGSNLDYAGNYEKFPVPFPSANSQGVVVNKTEEKEKLKEEFMKFSGSPLGEVQLSLNSRSTIVPEGEIWKFSMIGIDARRNKFEGKELDPPSTCSDNTRGCYLITNDGKKEECYTPELLGAISKFQQTGELGKEHWVYKSIYLNPGTEICIPSVNGLSSLSHVYVFGRLKIQNMDAYIKWYELEYGKSYDKVMEEKNNLITQNKNKKEELIQTVKHLQDSFGVEIGATIIENFTSFGENYIGDAEASSVAPFNGEYSMYAPHRVFDQNTRTAWREGKVDYGIGEYIKFKVKPTSYLENEIYGFNGVFKIALGDLGAPTKNDWLQDTRPKRLKIYYNDVFLCNVNLNDIHKIQQFSIREWLNLDSYFKNSNNYVYDKGNENGIVVLAGDEIKFEILEVYPGDLNKITTITEIFSEGY